MSENTLKLKVLSIIDKNSIWNIENIINNFEKINSENKDLLFLTNEKIKLDTAKYDNYFYKNEFSYSIIFEHYKNVSFDKNEFLLIVEPGDNINPEGLEKIISNFRSDIDLYISNSIYIKNALNLGSEHINDYSKIGVGNFIFSSNLIEEIREITDWNFSMDADRMFFQALKHVSKNMNKIDFYFYEKVVDRIHSHVKTEYLFEVDSTIKHFTRLIKLDSIEKFDEEEFEELFEQILYSRKSFISKKICNKFFANIDKKYNKYVKELWNNKNKIRYFTNNEIIQAEHNLQTINYDEYRKILFDMFKRIMFVLKKYEVNVYPMGMTIFGQQNGGEPVIYDDDIDISVDAKQFLTNKKNIVKELEKENIYILFWTDKGGPNQMISLNKIFNGKIYRIYDEKYSIDSISTPFIDMSYSSIFKRENYKLYRKIHLCLLGGLDFGQTSKTTSDFIEKRYKQTNTWEIIENKPKFPKIIWKFMVKFRVMQFNYLISKIIKLDTEHSGKKFVIAFDFDMGKWGKILIDYEQENKTFIGVDNLISPIQWENSFIRRYGKKPHLLENENATPSHINRESNKFIFFRNTWLNCDAAVKITGVTLWKDAKKNAIKNPRR